jgi:hypothetical protein
MLPCTVGGAGTVFEHDGSAALVTNTMLVQAARLLAAPESLLCRSRLEALFDFSSLAQAVVLRPELVTLEGRLNGRSATAFDYPLVRELERANVLRTCAVPLDLEGARHEVVASVGVDRAFGRLDLGGIADRVSWMLPEIMGGGPADVTPSSEHSRAAFMMLASHPASEVVLAACDGDIERLFRGDAFVAFLRGTGSTQRGAYLLRTFIYTSATRRHRIALVPDFPRLPLLSAIVDRLHVSLVEKHFVEISRHLQLEADEFLEESQPVAVPMPPIASIVLARAGSPENIPSALLELRDELSSLRSALVTYEEALRSSTTIEERTRARTSMVKTFEAAERRLGDSERGFTLFKQMLDLAGDGVRVGLNWSNPSSYRTTLLTQPLEWARAWWRTRPLAQFFDVASEFRRISAYAELVPRLFGFSLGADEIADFRSAQRFLVGAFGLNRERRQ